MLRPTKKPQLDEASLVGINGRKPSQCVIDREHVRHRPLRAGFRLTVFEHGVERNARYLAARFSAC